MRRLRLVLVGDWPFLNLEKYAEIQVMAENILMHLPCAIGLLCLHSSLLDGERRAFKKLLSHFFRLLCRYIFR
jgi:hypothetical protein